MVVLAVAGIYWLVNADTFRLDPASLEVRGLVHTAPEAARDTMGLAEGTRPNLFKLRTTEIARALAALPAVARAEVNAVLPNRLVVVVTEREPVFVLATAARSFLVDRTGVLVNELPQGGADPGLPRLDDRRSQAGAGLEVGGVLDPIDLEAALQLLAITPDLLATNAGRLQVTVEDDEGFVMTTDPASWRAVFGLYTPTLRPPSRIAQQVQCLRSLLGQGEADVRTAYLEPVGDRCGTFEPRQTPARTTPSPEPSR